MINTHTSSFAMMGQGSGGACALEQQTTLQFAMMGQGSGEACALEQQTTLQNGNCEHDDSHAEDDSDGMCEHFSPLKKLAVPKTRTKKEWQLVSTSTLEEEAMEIVVSSCHEDKTPMHKMQSKQLKDSFFC
jgi:hypothetical protein